MARHQQAAGGQQPGAVPSYVFDLKQKLGRSWAALCRLDCPINFSIMMNALDYKARSAAATARADLETNQVAKAHHRADASSWEALADMAERHAAALATFKI